MHFLADDATTARQAGLECRIPDYAAWRDAAVECTPLATWPIGIIRALRGRRVGCRRVGSVLDWRQCRPYGPGPSLSSADRLCVVSTDSWPSQRAMTLRSTLCCSSSIAVLCLSTCGVTVLPTSDPQLADAASVYL